MKKQLSKDVKRPCSFCLKPDLSEWLKEEAWKRRTSASALVESLIIELKAKESGVKPNDR